MVRPIISGRIVEARDHVLMTERLLAFRIAMTFASSDGWM
jgi:hypothetical protein